MKKVAAYCRVSTEQDDQLNSLENQKHFFESYINKNIEWDFVKIYVDEGISGTSVKKRKGFNQMIKDAEDNRFDLLLTKEISRFARNTLDSIFYTRKLKELGIGVYFMNDNINTLDADAELRLTIMSSIAQEESRKTSDRVRWGQKRSMESGVVFGTSIFGYDIIDGKLYTNDEQSEIVRLIFDLYLNAGMGTHILCHELENRGIISPSGSHEWKNASILRILKNEKYIGILKQKKAITTDYLSHRRKINEGEEDYIIIENNHEPIIDKDTFYSVQQEIDRRRTFTFDKGKYSNRYAWSGKLECGFCKSKFKRKVWNSKSPNPKIVWQCSNNIKYGSKKENEQGMTVGCDCKATHEKYLEQAVLYVLNQISVDKEKVIQSTKDVIREVLQEDDTIDNTNNLISEIEKIEKRKHKLIELFYDDAISKAEYKKLNNDCNTRIEQLQEQIRATNKTKQEKKDLDEVLARVDTLITSIANLETFSEEVAKQVLYKIVINGRESVDIYINASGGNTVNFLYPFR